uniref:Adenosine deaminase n=1 Tax=Panagrellus redivivus TaxID=6233 RepID=A0A7E4VY93_PANRE
MLLLRLSALFFSTAFAKPIFTKYDGIRALPKVELHAHLDGSIRLETMLEMAKQKNVSLYNATTVEELKKHVVTSKPTTLAKMLEPFDHFLPLFKDNLEAIERIAYEQVQDQWAKGVVYFETRYSPNLFCTDGGNVTSRQVVDAVSRGLAKGEEHFGVMGRQLVCCIRGLEKYAEDVLAIAIEYRNRGVVGIDTAGASYGADEQYGPEIVSVFRRAAELGIPTTAHAGESGTANQVQHVIENMKVHRVGHGYHIIQNDTIYDKYAVSNKTIHFEACPTSSVMTSSMPMDWDKHAITRWAQDDVNFSLNTDDPTLFDTNMVKEMNFASEKFKMNLTQIWQTQLNAAKASFLPADLKAELIEVIEEYKPIIRSSYASIILNFFKALPTPFNFFSKCSTLEDMKCEPI